MKWFREIRLRVWLLLASCLNALERQWFKSVLSINRRGNKKTQTFFPKKSSQKSFRLGPYVCAAVRRKVAKLEDLCRKAERVVQATYRTTNLHFHSAAAAARFFFPFIYSCHTHSLASKVAEKWSEKITSLPTNPSREKESLVAAGEKYVYILTSVECDLVCGTGMRPQTMLVAANPIHDSWRAAFKPHTCVLAFKPAGSGEKQSHYTYPIWYANVSKRSVLLGGFGIGICMFIVRWPTLVSSCFRSAPFVLQ